MDYYKFLLSMRNQKESIPDDDMRYFKARIEHKKRDIVPTEFYADIYFGQAPNVAPTVHRDFINAGSYHKDPTYPWKSKNLPQRAVIGVYPRGNEMIHQPIFNDDLLTDINQNNKKVVYSKRNK